MNKKDEELDDMDLEAQKSVLMDIMKMADDSESARLNEQQNEEQDGGGEVNDPEPVDMKEDSIDYETSAKKGGGGGGGGMAGGGGMSMDMDKLKKMKGMFGGG